jgi:hypothetical protein
MASSKQYKFSYGEQINQYTPDNYSAVISTTVSTLTVPYLSSLDAGIIAVITCRALNDRFISVACNATPIVPTSSTFSSNNGLMIDSNGILKTRVKPGDVLSFIASASGTYVCVAFYTADSF